MKYVNSLLSIVGMVTTRCGRAMQVATGRETSASLELGANARRVGHWPRRSPTRYALRESAPPKLSGGPSILRPRLGLHSVPNCRSTLHTTHIAMLYLVGLGLADERDITVKGLEIVKKAERVYLEAYTAILLVEKDALVSAPIVTLWNKD